MTRNLLYNSLTICILVMAIVQAPFTYYYTSGSGTFLFGLPYMLVGAGLTTWLLIAIRRDKKDERNQFQRVGFYVTIIIGFFSLLVGSYITEILDWELRRNTREEIVHLVKNGTLKPNRSHNNTICTLPKWSIPPISNGGNEIVIYKADEKIRVEFFIDRGFLDHYSAFVYSNDSIALSELDERANRDYHDQNRKLDDNWYRVSY